MRVAFKHKETDNASTYLPSLRQEVDLQIAKWFKNLLHYAADGIFYEYRWLEEQSLGIGRKSLQRSCVSVVKRPSGFFYRSRIVRDLN